MLPIARLVPTFNTLWQNLPRGSVPVFFGAVSALLARQITSDYRIRAAIILGTLGAAVGIPFLVKKVHQYFFFKFEELREPPQLEPLEKDPHSYLSLLPNALLLKTGSYIDYATYRTWDPQHRLDSALHEVRIGYRTNPDAEVIARQALALDGVPFCAYVGETALENWKRYQTVLAPASRLFQGISHRLSVKKMGPSAKELLIKGPLLVVSEARGCVAYHWPTGRVQWIQPDRTILFKHMDLLTGQRIAQTTLFRNNDLDQVEILKPQRLFYHNLKQEILLSQNCTNILFYQHPILFFENEKGIWLKNGDQPEILTELPKPYSSLTFYLVQPPYFIVIYSAPDAAGQGVYHMKDGKRIAIIPLRVALEASIRQRMDFSSQNPTPQDDLFYVTLQNHKYCEVRVSLQNAQNTETRVLENYAFSSWRGGAFHLDMPLGKMVLHSFHRPISHFPLEKVSGLLYGAFNQYVLISQRAANNLSDFFVIDLAEQSLIAERGE